MLTLERLKEAIRAADAVRHAWQGSTDTGLLVAWRGLGIKAISGRLTEVWLALIDLCQTADAERAAKPVILAVDAFATEFEKWAGDCETYPETTSPNASTHTGLWRTWTQVVEEATRPPHFPKPEPIGVLMAQKLTPLFIAKKIYHWTLPNGEADLQKLQEEIEHPGRHYKPEEWTGPAERRYWAEVDARWAARAARMDHEVADEAERAEHMKPPESLETLLRQRVPSKQIRKILGVTQEDIFALAGELGLPVDGQPVSRGSREADNEQYAEAEERMNTDTHPEIESRDDRILAMFLDGKRPGQIANALQDAFPGLSVQAVSAVIQAANRPKT